MATTELKSVEKLVKEVLDIVKGSKKDSEENKNFEDINSKLDAVLVSADTSKELIQKVDKLSKKIDKKSKDYVKEIQEAFENYNQKKLEMFSEEGIEQSGDIRDFTAIITNEILELKKTFSSFSTEFSDLSLNTTMATSKEIISMKNYVLSLTDSIDELKKKIETSPKELLIPVSDSVREVFDSSLNNFKDSIFNIIAKIMDGVDNIISKSLENAKIYEGFENSLGEITHNQQKNKDEIVKIIKANVSDENKKLLPKIMQIVDSISFDENTEEIKECITDVNNNVEIVNNNIEILNQNLETKIDELKESVNIDPEITNDILEKVNSIDDTVEHDISTKISKIKETLETVTNDFNVLTKGSKEDTEEYTYTLLDLESDISKVRILLDDLTKALQDDKNITESSTKDISDKIATISEHIHQTEDLFTAPDYKALLLQFDALNDDITSISKRTNKLILTSDDSSIKLEKNIADFQEILQRISLSVKNFEKSTVIRNISIGTENLQKMMQVSLQSDNAVNEAFIHLADWIDETSSELQSIKTEVSSLSEKISNLSSSEGEDLPTKDVSKLIKKISVIEEKIQENSDIKSSIDYLVTQMQITNEIVAENKAMSKKIDKMEKQIQQLLSYVEEEEEEE